MDIYDGSVSVNASDFNTTGVLQRPNLVGTKAAAFAYVCHDARRPSNEEAAAGVYPYPQIFC